MGRPLTEHELVERARGGDGAAYAALVRDHEETAFRIAYVICGSAADAEEAAQEAFVKAYNALGRFRLGEPLRPWLLAIVANEARNRRRSAGRRAALALRAAGEERPAGEAAPSPEAALLAGERRAALLAGLGRLNERDRTVIACRYLLELSEAETAATLGRASGDRQVAPLARARPAAGGGGRACLSSSSSCASCGSSGRRRRTSRARWPSGWRLRRRRRAGRCLDRPAWQLAVAATALIIAVVMAVPPARSAVLDLLGFGSVRIVREEPRPSRFASGLGLGEPVTLEQARRRFPVLVPAAVGEPDAVYLTEDPSVRVDLVYRERPGLPASGNTGAGLLVTEFHAVAEPLIEKTVGAGSGSSGSRSAATRRSSSRAPTTASRTSSAGSTGAFEPQRLAGNTLLVERSDGVLLRIEGELDRDEAVRIAESVD